MVKRVAIVGAGPSGLLMAHYLLLRGNKYQIDIYERRSDPRLIPFSKARTFPISLSQRGMGALQKIPVLVEAVKAISVGMKGSISHQKNGKKRVTTRENFNGLELLACELIRRREQTTSARSQLKLFNSKSLWLITINISKTVIPC